MLKTVEQKVLKFINRYNLLQADKKVLLAVSGGADSVALFKILFSLKYAGRLNNDFHIAHINHQLRGQSSIEDEEFVKSLAGRHNLPVTIEHVDVRKYARENKLSIETAARHLRLEKLAMLAEKNNCSCIAAAHQKNDNAETVIHRLLRGTGLKGLAGIRPKINYNDSIIIRPLLCISRDEIEDYLSSKNMSWQTDQTNIDCRFTRNRIRHKLLPCLQSSSNNSIIESLFDLSRHCLGLSEKIENEAKAKWRQCVNEDNENFVSFDICRFSSCPSFVKVEIIQKALCHCGFGLQKFTSEHYEKILKFLMEGRNGKILQLPGRVSVKKNEKAFYLGSFKSAAEKPLPIKLKVPGKTVYGEWIIETRIFPAKDIDIIEITKNKNNLIQWFDLNRLKKPIQARCRQKGDRFSPFGGNANKRIGKFLTSAKTDFKDKKKTFIISDSENILWLAPIRRSIVAKIDTSTLKILKILLFYSNPVNNVP